jgi:hypothetical protein
MSFRDLVLVMREICEHLVLRALCELLCLGFKETGLFILEDFKGAVRCEKWATLHNTYGSFLRQNGSCGLFHAQKLQNINICKIQVTEKLVAKNVEITLDILGPIKLKMYTGILTDVLLLALMQI